MAIPDTQPVVLDEALLHRFLRFLAPACLFLVAGAGFWRTGELRLVPVLFAIAGIGLLLISLFDTPHRVVLDADGVHRHCVLRQHSLTWDEVTAFERPPRAPSAALSLAKLAGAGGAERKPKGLVVRVGPKRRIMLLSAAERPDQWDQMAARLNVWAPGVSLPRRPGG